MKEEQIELLKDMGIETFGTDIPLWLEDLTEKIINAGWCKIAPSK